MENKDAEKSLTPWNLCKRSLHNDKQKIHSNDSQLGFPQTRSQSLPSSPGSSSSGSLSSWDASRSKDYRMYRNLSSRSPLDQDLAPRFSGMNFGDVMKITVMKEMESLKMMSDHPLDLSKKSGGTKKS